VISATLSEGYLVQWLFNSSHTYYNWCKNYIEILWCIPTVHRHEKSFFQKSAVLFISSHVHNERIVPCSLLNYGQWKVWTEQAD